MNATEAREIAEANGDKIAKHRLKEAIETMEEKIMKQSESGFVCAKIDILNQGPWDRQGCTEKFKEHFESKGFEVCTVNLGRITTLSCRW